MKETIEHGIKELQIGEAFKKILEKSRANRHYTKEYEKDDLIEISASKPVLYNEEEHTE